MTIPDFSKEVKILRPYWAASLIDTVTLTRTTAAGAFSTAAGTYAAPSESTTTGIAALISYGDHTRPDFGQEAADRDTYTVFMAFDADVQRDDRLTVTAAALDADLVNSELVVRSVASCPKSGRV